MREITSFNPVAPTSIVAYAEVTSIKEMLLIAQQQEQHFSSEDEAIYYLTHKVNNIIHNDGRIYMKLDNNGLLFANSVSPYSETFFNNIEPKIAPLVVALHKKRYLTYSSCEGHGYTFRRYVGLAFSDEDSRQYVINEIKKLHLYGVELRTYNQVVNQNVNLNQKNPRYTNKYKPTELNETEQITKKESEIKTFNIQFHRNYENYYFLEIVIFSEVPPFLKDFIKKPFKNLWLCFMKKYFWDKTTQKITNVIESSEFKKYSY